MVSVPGCPATWGHGLSAHWTPRLPPLQVVPGGPPPGVTVGRPVGEALAVGCGVFELGMGLAAGWPGETHDGTVLVGKAVGLLNALVPVLGVPLPPPARPTFARAMALVVS